ncbi:MAG: hypothetical protein HUU17_06105 [Chthonomonadales bacterium]|nr:hypothetical protein [Chthonomonadales bacterium]
MEADERRRLDRIEQAMFGVRGDNGLYGDMRQLRREVTEGFDKLEEKHSGLYKLLAVTALSVLGSGLGVVVTLLSTGGS